MTPCTVARQAALSWEFSRQEYWSGLPCPPPGHLPNPGIEPRSPALQADSLPSERRSPWILEWIAYPFSRGTSQPRNWPGSPLLQADSLPAELPGMPLITNKSLSLSTFVIWKFKLIINGKTPKSIWLLSTSLLCRQTGTIKIIWDVYKSHKKYLLMVKFLMMRNSKIIHVPSELIR